MEYLPKVRAQAIGDTFIFVDLVTLIGFVDHPDSLFLPIIYLFSKFSSVEQSPAGSQT